MIGLSLGPASGDDQLARHARSVLGERGHHQVAVALLDHGRPAYAGFGGVTETTSFEIGSITKALTGMLLADLAERGVVGLDQPVGSLVPGTPLAGARATLQELGQHRSGLPRLPHDPRFVARVVLAQLAERNPYRGNAIHVLKLAAGAGANGGAPPNYSNLGFSALGDALALQQGMSYRDLLGVRVLKPLGMASTTIAASTAELPVVRAAGRGPWGWRQPPWIAEGGPRPCIGVWSTAQDLAQLAQGVLEKTAPGASAATATRDFQDGRRIGLGWITSTIQGRQITWHNGETGGFAGFVGLDHESERAVVMLSATARNVDGPAIRLLIGSA